MTRSGQPLDEALQAIAAGATADDVESNRLDFKRQGRSRDDTLKDLAHAAACFANALGGVLVVGVRDRVAGSDAFEGCDLDPDVVARRIYELTDPHLTVHAETMRSHGVTLLVVQVPRSPEIHQVEGRATHRVGKACEPLSSAQIATLLAERRGEDWSAVETGRDPHDVSAVALGLARELLRRHPDPRHQSHAERSDLDVLRVLGLIGPGGHLVRAGELLLCEPDAGTVDLIAYQYRRTPAGEPVFAERLPAPLLPALVRVLDVIDARVDKTPVNLPNGQQLQFADLPEVAVREAVVNAVIHRDYRLPGPVRIEHAPTRLAVSSPGPLVRGVTVENILTTVSRPRNACLTGAVRILGLAEEAGVGVDRMYREMIRAGHNPPEFVEEPDQVRVTLRGGAPNKPLARFIATLPAAEADDADTLLVLHRLLTARHVTAQNLAPLLQKNVDEVEDVLRRLSAEPVSMIEPTRETARRAHPSYRLREHVVRELGTAVTYRRRTADEYDRKIVSLVREAGWVNAAMVRTALDLGTQQASRVLADLVERGVLRKTSEAQRGPSVRYGPGPRFPATRSRKRRGQGDVVADDPGRQEQDELF